MHVVKNAEAAAGPELRICAARPFEAARDAGRAVVVDSFARACSEGRPLAGGTPGPPAHVAGDRRGRL